MVALGAMIYLFVRSLPRVAEENSAEHRGIIDRLAASEFPEKIDAALTGFLAKFLRKLKVVLLKIDNALTAWLKKVKNGEEKNGKNGAPPNGIKNIAENKEEGL